MSWSRTGKSTWRRLIAATKWIDYEQSLFQQLLSWSAGIDVDAAIDLTLAARAYERYAEHAVAVAHRAALLAVGAPRN